MPENENIKNKRSIEEILSNICEEMHPSSEMILAYARGDLSKEGLSKIGKHIDSCNECAEILNLAKITIDVEKEHVSQDAEAESIPLPSPRIAAKAKLASILSARRDRLVEAVAKLLLPKGSWISIKPTIIVVRARQNSDILERREGRNQLPAAAFSSGAGINGAKDYDTIIKVVDFVDLVHDLLLERCERVTDIKAQLPICVDKAMVILDDLNLDENTKCEISNIILQIFSEDEA